jgi:hypothetical protein
MSGRSGTRRFVMRCPIPHIRGRRPQALVILVAMSGVLFPAGARGKAYITGYAHVATHTTPRDSEIANADEIILPPVSPPPGCAAS